VISPDVVNLTQSGTFAQSNVGTGIAITSTSTIDNANYILTQPTLTARDITAKALTITGATTVNKEYDRTNVASVTGGTLQGVILPDVVNLTQSGTFAQSNVGTGIAITSTSTIDNANYILTQPTLTARDITPKTTIINIVASNKQYDGTTIAAVTPSSSSFIFPDNVTITYASAAFDTKDVGINKIVTVTGISLSGTDAPNYVVASTTATASADITGTSIPFAVPNAFTPNGDGKNDTFKIIFNNPTGVSLILQIFNRNGILLFTTTDINKEWDGRSLKGAMQDVGIYFVKYRIQIAGGMTYEDTPRIYLFK
jgi:gliding motility-associated-like protein